MPQTFSNGKHRSYTVVLKVCDISAFCTALKCTFYKQLLVSDRGRTELLLELRESEILHPQKPCSMVSFCEIRSPFPSFLLRNSTFYMLHFIWRTFNSEFILKLIYEMYISPIESCFFSVRWRQCVLEVRFHYLEQSWLSI